MSFIWHFFSKHIFDFFFTYQGDLEGSIQKGGIVNFRLSFWTMEIILVPLYAFPPLHSRNVTEKGNFWCHMVIYGGVIKKNVQKVHRETIAFQ